MFPLDVSTKVEVGEVDGEHMPIRKCVCGTKFPDWKQLLSIYDRGAWTCPVCNAKLYFRMNVRVFQICE